MPLVTVKEKFQVTIPTKVRDQIAIHIGDILEATVEEGSIVLRPKAVVDRAVLREGGPRGLFVGVGGHAGRGGAGGDRQAGAAGAEDAGRWRRAVGLMRRCPVLQA